VNKTSNFIVNYKNCHIIQQCY